MSRRFPPSLQQTVEKWDQLQNGQMESRTFQNSTRKVHYYHHGINNFVERETKEKELFILLTEITIRVKPSYWEAFQKAP